MQEQPLTPDNPYPEHIMEAIESAGIPIRFRKANLVWAKVGPTVKACRKYVNTFMDGDLQGMILAGDTGSGKTHYACATANEILKCFRDDYDVQVKFFNINVDLSRLLDMRYFKRYDDYAVQIRALETSDLLIVDDLLHVPSVEWAKEVIYRIYEARYANKLRTITTLNAPVLDDGTPDWEALRQVFNDPLTRRIVDSASSNIIVV